MMMFTETKCGWNQLQKLPGLETWLSLHGYNYVFSHWSSDIKKNRHGHAGLLFISKIEPLSMRPGVDDANLDKEARVIIAEFEHFHFVGGYLPCAYPQPARLVSKLVYEKALREHLVKVVTKSPKPVVFAADFNVNPRPQDYHRDSFSLLKMGNTPNPPGCSLVEIETCWERLTVLTFGSTTKLTVAGI